MNEFEPCDEFPEFGDDRLDGADLCIACLAELQDGGNQCPSCAAPVTPQAAIAPFERILAEGFIYRRGVAEPRRLLVVIGVCLVFGLCFLSGLWLVYLHHLEFELDSYYVLMAYFNLIVGVAGVWQCVRNYRRRLS